MWLADLFETYLPVLGKGRINVQSMVGFSKIQKKCSLFHIHIVRAEPLVIAILLRLFQEFFPGCFLSQDFTALSQIVF